VKGEVSSVVRIHVMPDTRLSSLSSPRLTSYRRAVRCQWVERLGGAMDIFVQQILNGLVLGSVYAIIALGYTMVYGILGIINFAHGDVLMVGAMVALSA
jgi:ABC-type branched-subunit amino acid transport system permease subunit